MPTALPPVTIFSGGSAGYGHAIGGPDTYHHAINWSCLTNGRSVPALAPTQLDPAYASSGFRNPIGAIFEWFDSTGLPLILIADGSGTASARVWKLQGNANAIAHSAAIPQFTGGCLYRYDQDPTADPDEEMAFFCNGTATPIADAHRVRRRKKDATFDFGATVTHTMQADGLWVVGPDIWASQGYKIAKGTINADPGLVGTFPTFIGVGIPSFNINAVVPLGRSPVVLKGDGVFIYNPALSTPAFDLITPMLNPHPDNGKGGFTDGRGRVYCPTADGDITVFTFGFQSQQKPTKITTIDRDTPAGRITAMTADMEHVYAAIKPGHVRTQADSEDIKAYKLVGSTYTALSCTDDTPHSDVSIATLTAGDTILVGSIYPFHGFYLEVATPRTAAGSTDVCSISYSSDTAGTFVGLGGSVCFDGTMEFAQSGLMYISTDIYAQNLWKKSDPPASGTTRYWMKYLVRGTLTGVTLRNISVVPYRPPLDWTGEPVTSFASVVPYSGLEQAGCLPKVLIGTWQGEDILWHEGWTVLTGEIQKLVVSRTNSQAASTSQSRSLYMIGTDRIHYVPVGAEASPIRSPFPRLADYGDLASANSALSSHQIKASGCTFDLPFATKRLTGPLQVTIPFLQSDDAFYVFTRWDEEERWQKHGPYNGGDGNPILVQDVQGHGRVLYTAYAFVDGSRTAVAPQLISVTAPDYEVITTEPKGKRDVSSPQVI